MRLGTHIHTFTCTEGKKNICVDKCYSVDFMIGNTRSKKNKGLRPKVICCHLRSSPICSIPPLTHPQRHPLQLPRFSTIWSGTRGLISENHHHILLWRVPLLFSFNRIWFSIAFITYIFALPGNGFCWLGLVWLFPPKYALNSTDLLVG